MNRQKSILLLLIFGTAFVRFFTGCNSNNETTGKEIDELKNKLFDNTAVGYKLPVYADPPTADYEDLKKGIFLFQIDSNEIENIKKYRNELEPFVLQYIDSGYTWVYVAAFLKYESAVPKIKYKLLSCYEFYGWEGPDYSKIESYLNDDIQYCYQMAYISAIEYITSKPIESAITLTSEEYNKLKEKSGKCLEVNSDEIITYCAARWLLKKLKKE